MWQGARHLMEKIGGGAMWVLFGLFLANDYGKVDRLGQGALLSSISSILPTVDAKQLTVDRIIKELVAMFPRFTGSKSLLASLVHSVMDRPTLLHEHEHHSQYVFGAFQEQERYWSTLRQALHATLNRKRVT